MEARAPVGTSPVEPTPMRTRTPAKLVYVFGEKELVSRKIPRTPNVNPRSGFWYPAKNTEP